MNILTTIVFICILLSSSLSQINISKSFEPLSIQYNSQIPTWVATSSNYSHIHRFFDSSSISPSGKFLVVTRIPKDERTLPFQSPFGEVIIIDLSSGFEDKISNHAAWDTQTGAHAQWGGSDNQLIFNEFQFRFNEWIVKGVVYNMFSKQKTILDCTIYHSDLSGLYSASPTLELISKTQQGYSFSNNHPTQNKKFNEIHNLEQDGLFLTNLLTGQCELKVSLKTFASIASIDISLTPIYGFHTKWSFNSKYIMFIIRTLELSSNSFQFANFIQKSKRIRRQHLFIINIFTNEIQYLLSWCSKSFYDTTLKKMIRLADGNHPNWIPNELNYISMNIESKYLSNKSNNENSTCKWTLIVIDIKNWNRTEFFDRNHTQIIKQYECSSGHPSFHSNGKHVLIDAYAKESHWFNYKDNQVPLRLINIETQTETVVMTMNVIRSNQIQRELSTKNVKVIKGGDIWRCDLHPAWNRNYTMFTINGRPDGTDRQVIISTIDII